MKDGIRIIYESVIILIFVVVSLAFMINGLIIAHSHPYSSESAASYFPGAILMLGIIGYILWRTIGRGNGREKEWQ